MKKMIVCIIIIILIGIIGFYLYNENKQKEILKKEIIPLAEDYFDKYVSTNTSSNTYIITLKDLKEKNEYDLSKFSNCKDIKVSFVVHYKTAKIIKNEVELNCR